MYLNFEDLRELLLVDQASENPGIFIEHMGKCYEPVDVVVDDDGDIIIRI